MADKKVVDKKKTNTKKTPVKKKKTVKKNDVVVKEVVEKEIEEVKQPEIVTPVQVVKPKKKFSKFKIFLLIFLGISLVVILYTFLFKFNSTSTFEGDNKTRTGEMSFEIKLKGNKPIVTTYYAFDPEDENDKSLYEEIDAEGYLFDKTVKFDNLQVPAGKRQLCIYVESYLLTHDVECHMINFELGYVNKFDENNIISIADGLSAVKNELIVVFDSSASDDEIDELVKRYNAEIVGKLYFVNMYQIKFDASSKSKLEFLIDKLSNEDIVENVNYNLVTNVSFNYSLNDVKFDGEDWNNEYPDGKNWYLELIEATDAWDMVKDAKMVNVGVMDSPINRKHEDLKMKNSSIFYLPSNDYPTYDDLDNKDIYLKHGTNVAGLIGAVHNNKGLVGIGLNSNLYYANNIIFDDGKDEFKGDFASFAYALSSLVMSNCRVINMSFEYNEYKNWEEFLGDNDLDNYMDLYELLFTEFDNANRDYIITKAAGNDGRDAAGYYYNYILKNCEKAEDHVLIVGAVDSLNTEDIDKEKKYKLRYNKASFSNYGELVDVFAPGVSIYGLGAANDDYITLSGTSQSAAIVAGLAELLYAYNPKFTYDVVMDMIRNVDSNIVDNDSTIGVIINSKEAVLNAKEFDGIVPDKDYSDNGFVSGVVVDASTNKPLDDKVKVYITNTSDKDDVYYSNVISGMYDIVLPVGEYDFTFKYDGYVPETIYSVKVEDDKTTNNVKLSLVKKNSKKSVVSGYVRDVTEKNKNIPNANLKFIRGIDSDEEVIATAVTDKNGKYEVELEPGNYTTRVSLDGYVSDSTYVITDSGNKDYQDCSLSPLLKDGEFRVVLTWVNYPFDLDSHLVGPTPNGEPFHIYYGNKIYEYNNEKYDSLDLDDSSSSGMETVSVSKMIDGDYTYYVHDFESRNTNNSKMLASSMAQVKLYVANREEPYVYNVPNKNGNLWKVFKISDGKVISINEMGYEIVSANVGID